MTKPLTLKLILAFLVPVLCIGLPGCTGSDAPVQAAAQAAAATPAVPAHSLRAMGLPPLGSTYEEFVKALPANVSLSLSRSIPNAFEISPPQEYYGGIKTTRLVVQFKQPESATERYWKLIAAVSLPWSCSAEDGKVLFEREEPALKSDFEFTDRALLPNGNGAVLSGISRNRMASVEAECGVAPAENIIFVTYVLLDPNVFAYTNGGPQRMLNAAYAKRPRNSGGR